MEFDVRRFESLDSTNRYALDAARAGASEGLVVVADHQTAGRGRRGRTWEAPPGSSLLVSVLLRPALPAGRHQLVSMAVGVAMAAAVERVAGVAPALKWPNDLVVDGRKLAGMLAEADVGADGRVLAVVVGIGVNLEWGALSDDLAKSATACDRVAGRPVERNALLDAFLDELSARCADLQAAAREYRRRLVTLGRRVRVERAGDEIVGRAVDVGPAGELRVETDSGRAVDVHVGDVVHLRSL